MTYTEVSQEDSILLDFPTLKDLGGPAVIPGLLLGTPSGLALISGKHSSGKTTTLAAVANELSRAGRNVLAVRTPDASHVPGVDELFVHTISATLEKDLLIGDKCDVIILDEIRTFEAAVFAAKLLAAGILVIATIKASDPTKALWEYLRLCRGRRNKVVARELVFSYGVEIYESFGKDLPDPGLVASVEKARLLMASDDFHTNKPAHEPSSAVIVSDYIFPDAVTRKHILGYTKGYFEG